MRIALPVFIIPLSLSVTLDKAYNINAGVGRRGGCENDVYRLPTFGPLLMKLES